MDTFSGPNVVNNNMVLIIFCLQDSRDTSDEHTMSSFICDESNELIDLSDEEFDEAMAEVILLVA